MIDIFTALLAVVSICALFGVVTRIILTPPKVWDEDNRMPGEIEELSDYAEIRKANPHIWMD